MTLDHVACSELLGPLVAGRLDPARRAAVEAHLASCDECSEELQALSALVALETVELTPDERARLRSAITPVARRPAWARFMPALATAAVIALGVVAYGALDLGGMDGSGQSPTTAEGTDEQDGAEDVTSAGRAESLEAATNDAVRDEGLADDAIEGGDAAGTGGTELATPESADALMVTPNRAGAFAFTTLDPTLLELGARRLDFYARALPSAWSEQLETCTRRLFASQPVTLTLAYAQAFPRDDLLVAGFKWSESTSGEPTHFAFWGWWRGDCDTASPVHTRGSL